ncbi:hypothetical protein NECAME_13391 [Necator americanus]|uniref:glucuronosyltransferase n=1 Tax=Necator americanus TaxID=51031 RepID=W2SW36_NECAM|nr:hypothetical protein NECAME_13391 [Necator americanus]ETN73820.1 hypothetical protein NECAME_13391 [Necator americanus]
MPNVTFIWKYENENSAIAIEHTNVPLFGDQMRNARMLVRHGGAIMLQKFDIADAEKLRTAITTVLENPRYSF